MTVFDVIKRYEYEKVTFAGDYDLSVTDVPITSEVRSMCEQNLCGFYGRNWCCPPNTPPCETCRTILSKYKRMSLVRTTFERKELFDIEEMMATEGAHNDYARELRNVLRDINGLKFMLLSAGGCNYCGECSCPDEKCRFPNERLFSIEAYGIDLSSFLTVNGIERRAGNTEQSYFLMVFYNEPEE